VALVTGGGRGLGRVFAQALAAAGAAVAVGARSEDQLAETVSLIKARSGSALAVPFDVTDQQAVECAVETIQSRLGPVDLLVNNAGPVGTNQSVVGGRSRGVVVHYGGTCSGELPLCACRTAPNDRSTAWSNHQYR
jgi:NAD(P)-dependent dehydrogenase (short-subunit alcohol dehydrogenase family)